MDRGRSAWPAQPAFRQPQRPSLSATSSDEGIEIPTSGGLSADWTNRRYPPEDVWAYQPLASHRTAGRRIPGSSPHPIDAFIERPAAGGRARTGRPGGETHLVRRLTLDLTGLPPTPAQVDAFLADDSPQAYPQLVQRLLARPQYGEQMARYWLDVVRYADTSGFSNDFERPNAWRYRDYVIRSFQHDKPYDQFVDRTDCGR